MGNHRHNPKLIGRKTQVLRELKASKLLLLLLLYITIPITSIDLNSLRIKKKRETGNSRILSSFEHKNTY
jgi:hypothetical protein